MKDVQANTLFCHFPHHPREKASILARRMHSIDNAPKRAQEQETKAKTEKADAERAALRRQMEVGHGIYWQ